MTPTSYGTDTTTQAVPAVVSSAWDGFCAIAKAIPWTPKDDPRVVLAIKQHNHLGAVHCGWAE